MKKNKPICGEGLQKPLLIETDLYAIHLTEVKEEVENKGTNIGSIKQDILL